MKRIFFLCMVSILLLAGCAPKEPKYIDMGMQEIEKGNYEGALQNFDTGISKKEDLELAYRGKGIAYIGSKNYEAAIEQLKHSLKQATGAVHALELDTSYYLALAQNKKGDNTAAIETYSNIIKYDKTASEAYYLRGVLYLAQKEEDKALSDFQTVVSLEPNQYEQYLSIYQSLNANGYTDKGIEFLNKALVISGNSADNYYYRGVIYFQLNDLDKALEQLTKAKEAKNNKALFYLGKIYRAKEDSAQALSSYQAYLNSGESIENLGEVYNAIGLCQLDAGDFKSALESFQKGIEQNQPDSIQELLFNQVVAYEKLLDFKSAKDKMAEYIKRYPEDETAARENQFLKTR